jgi:methionyl-tRNA synthetase
VAHSSTDTREGDFDDDLIAEVTKLRDAYQAQMDKNAFQSAISEVFKVLGRGNKYIDETTPWILAKNEDDKPRLARVLYNLLETIRVCTILLTPLSRFLREDL